MNVWGVFKVAVRRWYVFVPLLAITVALAMKLPKDSAPSYTVQQTLTVLHPDAHLVTDPLTGKPKQVDDNPLLVDNGAMFPIASLLGQVMATKSSHRAIADAGYAEPFTVASGDREPTLTIDTTGKDEASATATNNAVADQIRKELDSRQKDYLDDRTRRVNIAVLTPPEVIEVAKVSKSRGALMIGLAGLIVALLVTLFVEAIFGRRPRKPAKPSGNRRSGPPSTPAQADPVLTR
ncbi:MAG: hypothetical protein JWM93_3871 [Frankiales bacterium]|nr:hypothetical protein [Frankiales bacterium]